MGIKGKKGKMPVCEDFRFLPLLNNYAAVKHAVFRKNFCAILFDYVYRSHAAVSYKMIASTVATPITYFYRQTTLKHCMP